MAIKEVKEEAEKPYEIPEGKVLKDVKVYCKKHGDITKSASFFSYETKKPDGTVDQKRAIFCIPCICEYLTELQKEGKLAEHALVPIYEDEKKEDSATEESKENHPTEESTESK